MPTVPRRSSRLFAMTCIPATLAFVGAWAAEIWCFVERDSDPRMIVGGYPVILHNTGGAGNVVIRQPDGSLAHFNYWVIGSACGAAFFVWLLVMFAYYYNRHTPIGEASADVIDPAIQH